MVLGYKKDGEIKHSQGDGNSYSAYVSGYSESWGKPRIFSFVHDDKSGKKTYINGMLAGSSEDKSNLSNIGQLTLGKSYQGQIGELIIFARALTDEERESVEDYLSNKWNGKIYRASDSLDGTVTNDGCMQNCSVPVGSGTGSSGEGSIGRGGNHNGSGTKGIVIIRYQK